MSSSYITQLPIKGDRVYLAGQGNGTVTRVCKHGEWCMVNWDDDGPYPARVWNPLTQLYPEVAA